jgi:hypothetical protein
VAGNTETNAALSQYTAVTGTDNTAGMKGFRIVAQTSLPNGNGSYLLESIEGIEVGDVYSVRHSNSGLDIGVVTSVSSDPSIPSIEVTNYLDKPLKTDADAKSEGYANLAEYLAANPWRNTISFSQKPHIGNVLIGTGAHAEGINNQALRVGAHAEGGGNKAIGEYAHVEGDRNTAKHCAHAEGR